MYYNCSVIQYTCRRSQMVAEVLASAIDNADALVIAACRRITVAMRRGWRRHGCANDLALVENFWEGMRGR